MTATTATLTDFLLARIAEDEAAALLRLAGGEPDAVPAISTTTAAAFVRLGAEIRRANVRLAPLLNRRRALPYADHPDYRDGWRP